MFLMKLAMEFMTHVAVHIFSFQRQKIQFCEQKRSEQKIDDVCIGSIRKFQRKQKPIQWSSTKWYLIQSVCKSVQSVQLLRIHEQIISSGLNSSNLFLPILLSGKSLNHLPSVYWLIFWLSRRPIHVKSWACSVLTCITTYLIFVQYKAWPKMHLFIKLLHVSK